MSEKRKQPTVRFKGFTESWKEQKLSSICSMHARIGWQNLRTSEFLDSGDYYLITGTDFEDGRVNLNTCHYVEKERYDQDKKIQISDGSILITKDGTLGKVAFVEGLDKPATLNAGVFNVEIIDDNVDNKFLFHYLKAPFLMDYVDKKATGGTIKHLNQNILVDFPAWLSIYDEQKKIGVFFQYLDKIIVEYQHKYDKLLIFKEAMLKKMFPKDGEKIPEIRFRGFTEKWKSVTFDEMADYKKGPFGSTLKKEIFVPKSIDTVKVYEQQNAINKNWKLERYYITRNYANDLKGFETHAGDIIVSCAGTIGEIYELPQESEPGIINQALMRVRVNEVIVNKKFYQILFEHMIDEFSREHSNGSAIKNIPPFADLKSMIALCPCIEEQTIISEYFSKIDTMIVLQEAKIRKINNIRKTLTEKMFV